MTDTPTTVAQADLEDLDEAGSEARIRRDVALVGDLVDRSYYALTNAELLKPGDDPVEHFCRVGWRLLRKPNPDFDTWWYWMNHLDPAVDDVNPLVHYALVGRDRGLSTRPELTSEPSAGARLPQDRPARRACLFASFDAHGLIDEALVLLVSELARHADVFFLADGYVAPSELQKLDGIVRGAWAVRHGSYDFGSYSMLARDLVGWDRLEEYDEVLLVNDSCFLVRPLDEVFATMDDRSADWWALQATKGLASTRENPRNGFTSPIPLDTVRRQLVVDYEDDPVYDFHLGSYFLAFRRPALDDPLFRRLLDSVHRQPSKLLVILKYEVGLTHLLIGLGHRFDTFVPELHPFHPMFTETHFELLSEGFPLLKRYLLYQNHYDIPGVAQWKEKVLAAAPSAPVDVFEETLVRSAPDDRLQRSYAITRKPDGTVKAPRVLRGRSYVRRDTKTAKRPDVWTFAVDLERHLLPDNSRAIFEAVRHDPSITKVILTRSRRVELTGSNVVVEPLLSPAGREQLMRSGVVLVGSRVRRSLQAPVTPDRQTILAVRAGLLLERLGRTAVAPRPFESATHARGPLTLPHPEPLPVATALLVASDVDRLAALSTYWPTTFAQTWATGLPAHDFLLHDEDALPAEFQTQLARLRAELGGRRLLLLVPTYRRSGTDRAPYAFTASEIAHLQEWSRTNGAVIGIREGEHDLERPYSAMLGEVSLDLSATRYPDLPVVLRAASAVLTDFSGAALDFAATGRPVISFLHDPEESRERILYDIDHFFPGPVARTFEELAHALGEVFDQRPQARHTSVRDLLLGGITPGATDRVLARITAVASEVS